MTETTPRREITQLRLIEAAIEQFASRGIDATSVEQLSEAAGFTRGAFYSNFGSKDDLCLAILEHQRDVMVSELARTFEEPPGNSNLDWAASVALPRFFSAIGPSRASQITMLEIRLRGLRNPELRARLKQFKAQTRAVLRGVVGQLAERVGIRLRLSLDNTLEIFEAAFSHALLDDMDSADLVAKAAYAICEEA